MKKLLTIILLCFAFQLTGLTQNKKLEKADAYFKQNDYNKALSAYMKLHKDNVSTYYVTLKIADCYRLTGNLYQAEQWYRNALKYPDVAPETGYYLGQVLMQLGKQTEATDFLKKYFDQKSSSMHLLCNDYTTYIRYLAENKPMFTIQPVSVNTSYSEYAPVVTEGKLVFSSNRPVKGIVNRGDLRTNRAFYDIYESEIKNFPYVDEVKPVDPVFNSKYNDGPVCFSADGNIAFITRNEEIPSNSQAQLTIIVANKTGKKWSKEIQKLSISQKGSSFAHPFITRDLSRLYYISNMPGGYGGMDIYYSEFRNGFMSAPVNLGPDVNTPGNETTPFMANDSTLYFASNGHPGLGGYDIYMAISEINQFTKTYNPGAPLNTEADEMGLFLINNGREGFFASNRQGGKGEDDIYALQILSPVRFVKISGTTISSDKFPLKGTIVSITDGNGHLFNEIETDDNGAFVTYLPAYQNFSIEFKRRYYQTITRPVSIDEMKQNSMQLIIEMPKK